MARPGDVAQRARFFSRRFAPWALALLTAFTIVFGIMEADAGQITRDDPFSGIWVLVLAVALGFLGLNHTRLAGGLLAALGAGQLVALFVDANRDGAGLADLLDETGLAERSPRRRVG